MARRLSGWQKTSQASAKRLPPTLPEKVPDRTEKDENLIRRNEARSRLEDRRIEEECSALCGNGWDE